jgi:hypothetical protein
MMSNKTWQCLPLRSHHGDQVFQEMPIRTVEGTELYVDSVLVMNMEKVSIQA